MPKFFFDIYEGGVRSHDEEGLDLPSLDRAKAEAMATLPAIAREAPLGCLNWTVRSSVRNEVGDVVFEATLQMELHELSGPGARQP